MTHTSMYEMPGGKDNFDQYKPDFDIESTILHDFTANYTYGAASPNRKYNILKKYSGNKKEIQIPQGVNVIGEGTPLFINTKRGMRIRMPRTTMFIRESAFQECKADVIIHKNVSRIEKNAFRNSTGYIKIDNFEHLSSIGSYAFAGCKNLRYLPDVLERTIVEPGAFMGCINLLNVPRNLTTIVSLVFKDCTAISEVPYGVKNIASRSFEGCTSLTSIPTTLENIGKEAFLNCTSLKEITIGLNLQEVEEDAFKGCPLEKINVPIEMKNFSHQLYHCNSVKHYHVKGIPLKKFIGNISLYKKNNMWISAIDIGEKKDSLVLQNIARGISEDKIKTDFWNRINLENFKSNLKAFRNVGMLDEEITTFFINNSILLGYDINVMLQNFNYINEEKIIPEGELKKLFFNDSSLNFEGKTPEEQTEILINYLSNYYNQNKCLPELFSRLSFEPTEENRLELRDNLLYVSGMNLLSNLDVEKRKKIKLMLNRTEFENIVEADKENFKKELKEKAGYIEFKGIYKDKFEGIKTAFYSKLSGLNSNYFDEFIKSMDDISDNSVFNIFMRSLNTVKHWDALEKKERAVLLKNEIVGRLLYATIDLSYTSDIVLPKEQDKKMILYTELKTKMQNLNFIEVLKKASDETSLFKNDSYVKFMLDVDPYSFDALRNSDELQAKNSSFVRLSGYLFDEEETNKQINIIKSIQNELTDKIRNYYLEKSSGVVHTKEEDAELEKVKQLSNQLKNNLFSLSGEYSYNDNHLFEFLNNKIGIPKLPEKDNKEYLKQIERVMKEYLKDNQNKNLNDFLRLLDFYMRSNSEYLFQHNKQQKIKHASTKVFDINSSINAHDRLLYSLYNLNKLAHSINEKHLKLDLIDKRLIDTETEYKNLTDAIKTINSLMDKNISLEDTLKFIGVGEESINEVQRKVKNKIELGNVNVLHKIFKSGITLVKNKLIDYEIVRHLKKTVSVEDKDDIKYKNGDEITRYLKTLLELKDKNVFNETNLEKIRILAAQRKIFFETKQIIAEELMKKTLSELNINKFIEMTEEQKYDFYKKNNYIVEVQRQPIRDNNTNEIIGYQPLLVCYSKTFNESFSVHMVGFSKEIETKVKEYINSDKYQATLSHTILTNPGLTLKEKINLEKVKPEQLITASGFAKSGVNNEYLSTLYNYIKYDLHDEIKGKTTITDEDIHKWFDGRFVVPKKLDMKTYIKNIDMEPKTKKSIFVSESIVQVLKKLHINFGALPPTKTTSSRKK